MKEIKTNRKKLLNMVQAFSNSHETVYLVAIENEIMFMTIDNNLEYEEGYKVDLSVAEKQLQALNTKNVLIIFKDNKQLEFRGVL